MNHPNRIDTLEPDDQISEALVQDLYEIAPCGYLCTRADGTILKANRTFLQWTSYAREDLVSCKRFQDLLTAPGRIFYETHYAPLLQIQGVVKEVTFDLTCGNRTLLPILVNSVQSRNEGGIALIHSAFFDVTDRRRYEQDLLRSRQRLEQEVSRRTAELEAEIHERQRIEEDLRELTSRLLRLRDDEQRRLARELHDSVGQLLVALSMNQSRILADPAIPPAISELVAENDSFISQLSAEVRTISYLLHPPLLDEVGLRSALQGFIEGFGDRSKLAVKLEIPPNLPRFQPGLETAIFRIVQECLTNIHRHSGSSSAKIRLTCNPAEISLEVSDAGKGTALTADQMKSGVGLRGMRERVRQLGGTLNFAPANPGMRISATFPMNEKK